MMALSQSLSTKTGIYVNIKHVLKRNTRIDGTAHKPKERMVKKIKQRHIRANVHWRETARVNTDILF